MSSLDMRKSNLKKWAGILAICLLSPAQAQVDQGSYDGDGGGGHGGPAPGNTRLQQKQIDAISMYITEVTEASMKNWERCSSVKKPVVKNFYQFYQQVVLLSTAEALDSCMKRKNDKDCEQLASKKQKQKKKSVLHCLISATHRKGMLRLTDDNLFAEALHAQAVDPDEVTDVVSFLKEKLKE